MGHFVKSRVYGKIVSQPLLPDLMCFYFLSHLPDIVGVVQLVFKIFFFFLEKIVPYVAEDSVL